MVGLSTCTIPGCRVYGSVRHDPPRLCLRLARTSRSRHLCDTCCLCQETDCPRLVIPYTKIVPRLWTETIAAHRDAVRDATLDTAAALVARHGLASVTMSQIAKETGIGRATLYKYFPDVESILAAWHKRQIDRHLLELAKVRDAATNPRHRLAAVLETYAQLAFDGQHGTELAALMHQKEHVAQAEQHLRSLVRDLIIDAARSGDIRNDISPDELTSYCLHALTAATNLPSKAAVRRLVQLTLDGIQPPG
jgi:AcrR family transcriptional regulator